MKKIVVLIAKTRTRNLKSAIRYADKDRCAEDDYSLCRGINCSDFADYALVDMLNVKHIYNKEGGRQCKHYVLSFAPDEITKDNAIEYSEKLAKQCFGDRFQAFVGLHTRSDSGVLHAHIIVNSVSHIDGYKLRLHKQDLERFKDINDGLAREYGLQVIDRSPDAVAKRGLPQLYSMESYQLHKKAFFNTENKNISYVGNCYSCVLNCIKSKPKSFDEFTSYMGDCGWRVKLRGKNITFTSATNSKHRIRANRMAKTFNDDLVSSAGILFCCNDIRWKDLIHQKQPSKLIQVNSVRTKRSKIVMPALKSLPTIPKQVDVVKNNKMKVELSKKDKSRNEGYDYGW